MKEQFYSVVGKGHHYSLSQELIHSRQIYKLVKTVTSSQTISGSTERCYAICKRELSKIWDLEVCHTFLFVHLLRKTNRERRKKQKKTLVFSKHLMAKITRLFEFPSFVGEMNAIFFTPSKLSGNR